MIVWHLVCCLESPRSILKLLFKDLEEVSHVKPVISQPASHVGLLSSGLT